jgi:hypothetical protein
MKPGTFADNLFASIALVKQEPIDKPFKTTDEEYEIKKGDLVLLARYGDKEEILYAILAEAHQPCNKTFHSLKNNGLRTLHPCYPRNHPCKSVLPPSVIDGPIDGCEYLMSKSAVGHPPSSTYIIYDPSYLTGNRIYIGFENVMYFLLTTPGYEPHAGALAISWMKYKNI